MFPTRVRATGIALGTQIGFAISGGLAPAVATYLAGDGMQNWLAPAVFVSVMCAISVGAALTAKETAHRTLEEIDALHTSRIEVDQVRNSRVPVTA